MKKAKVSLSLALVMMLGLVSGPSAWAIPSAGNYEFTAGGLTGTFSSDGTKLTQWDFVDSLGNHWATGLPDPTPFNNSTWFGNLSGDAASGYCATKYTLGCSFSLSWGAPDTASGEVYGWFGTNEDFVDYSTQYAPAPGAGVPTPTALSLLIAGLAGMGLARRLKGRSATI